jgi:hypothetical protein
MIKSIQHKGLRLYYEESNGSKLPREHLIKIARILTAPDAVTSREDILNVEIRNSSVKREV